MANTEITPGSPAWRVLVVLNDSSVDHDLTVEEIAAKARMRAANVRHALHVLQDAGRAGNAGFGTWWAK